MANFNLNNFTSQVINGGVAKPNRFEIQLPVPRALASVYGGETSRLVSLFCEAANLPVQTIGIKQQRIYGPAYPRPFSSEYGGEGITMSFLLDQSMNIKSFFDSWMTKIVDPIQYFVYYPSEYTVPIQIYQLDETDLATYGVYIEGAFPRTVSLLELNNTTQNQAHKLNVTFAYRRWSPIHNLSSRMKYPEVANTRLTKNDAEVFSLQGENISVSIIQPQNPGFTINATP